MRDLYRCLDEYSLPLLEAIAHAWQISLARGESRETVLQLAEAMSAPAALDVMIASLSAPAREALSILVREGGTIPGHRLSLRYGAIRRFGPVRLEREQPWLRPENALEELLYKGLIYRAYGNIGEYYGETFLVPQQLYALLSESAPQPAQWQVQQVDPPAGVVSDGPALAEDLFAILVHLRLNRFPVPEANGDPSQASLLRKVLDLGPRLVGDRTPERLALAWRLLWRMRLLDSVQGYLQPSLRAREWLRLSDRRRARRLFLAWRDDTGWDELRYLPSLHVEEVDGEQRPVIARKNLLAILAEHPSKQWLSLPAFVQVVKRDHPDYLRPDGDFDRWLLRDRQTDEPLSGFASWDQVDGALVRHLITGPLRWLGIVDLGYSAGPDQPTCFRWNDPAWQGGVRPEVRTEPTATPVRPFAAIKDDLTVTVSLANSQYERYQLERFAEWRAQKGQAVYQITEDSVWRSYSTGVNTEQIINFLKRASHDQAPPVVLRTLLAWGGRSGRVFLRRAVLLQTVDEQTMRQLRSHSEIKTLLGESVSATVCAVEEKDLDELMRRLKTLGIWPLTREVK